MNEGKIAFDYLTKERKISPAVLDMLEVGFCPLNTNHPLKGRIIYPIRDTYGELLAVSTRYIYKTDKPKFWHESFEKGSVLYNFHNILLDKNKKTNNSKYLVVEGELDVAVLLSHGFKYVVGICGSTFTFCQARLLAGRTSAIFIMLDGDIAGRNGIKRAMKIYDKKGLKSYGIEFIPVMLPEEMDPDEYIHTYGKQKLLNMLQESYNNKELYCG